MNSYEFAHKEISRERYLWRRAWDLNPRRFPLPVFKTGALGHYASPPWENLPLLGGVFKIQTWQRWFEMNSEAH